MECASEPIKGGKEEGSRKRGGKRNGVIVNRNLNFKYKLLSIEDNE